MVGKVNYQFWKKLSCYACLPAIGIWASHCYLEHKRHPIERPPFIPYEYLRIRRKKFPWGDGNHTLFHNPRVNPLPDGYEDECTHTPRLFRIFGH